MPEIIPIRDLKNTNAISQRCHETQEPIFVTKSGYRDMVIMSIRAPRMLSGEFLFMATPHNSRLTMRVPQPDIIEHFGNADAVPQPPERCLSRTSGAKAPRTLRPLPLLRFAVSATGGAHLCSIQYYLRFWLSSYRTSLAVSALRIMRYCPIIIITQKQYNSHNGQARCGCCFWCPFSRGKKSVPIYFDCIVDTAIIMPP